MTDPGSRRSDRRAGVRTALKTLGALLALWAVSPTSPASAQGTFARHLTITVGAAVVAGPHANFPLLVDVSNGELRTTGNGGQVRSTNGYDIVFRGEDDSICGGAGTSPCMLDHEIELYDGGAAGGRVVAWVRVPSLANGRVLHMYYGNSQITSSTEATGAVFDAGYVGVWHLKESGTGKVNEYRDSSRYGNHGQGGQGDTKALPTLVSGKIGSAQHFGNLADQTYDFIDAGQDGTLNITGGQITLQAWVRHNITVNTAHGCYNPPYSGNCPGGGSLTNHYGILNHKGYGDGYRFFLMGDPTWCPRPSGTLTAPCLGMGIPEQHNVISTSQYGAYPYTGPGSTDPVTNNAWHHVVGTYDGAEMELYVNGVKVRAEARLVYDIGTASVASGSPTVTFAGATLPASVGPGHVLTFTGANVENLVVLTRDSAAQVTLTTNAGATHANEGYRITSPFKTGNIPPSLAEQHVWIGQGDQQQNVGWSAEFEGDIDEVRISRVARSYSWIATEHANHSNPGTFYTVTGPAGVTQALPTPATVYRSIGTNSATLYSTGTASAALDGTVVTFAGAASIPANIGPGDKLDFTAPGPTETLFILSRDSATQVTVQTPAVSAHTGQTYAIERAYNTLQAWENALPADLVAANERHVGVAFDDGDFAAGVTFSGSVTDPARNIVLTTNLLDRQRGTPGSGVVLNNGSSATPAISISDDHVTIEYFEVTGGSGTGAHGIELASVNAANLGAARYNLVHDTPGDGIRLSDADSIVDVYNNFIFNTNVGIRVLVDMNPAARVNIFSNTVYNSTAAGIASLDAAGNWARQTSLRVNLRQNIAHSSPVDFHVAKPFDEAYFCTGLSGMDPTACTDRTTALRDQNTNVVLPFTAAASCLYLGSTARFRGVNHWLSAGGSGADLQWGYWNGASWTSLETGAFEDYYFQWDGFAYWPDDPTGWATRSVNAGASLYYARICYGSASSSPTERLIIRADVSVASRYNLARDKTGLYNSQWRGVGTTGVESSAGPIGAGVNFTSATDLHIQLPSDARDVVLDVPRQDTYLGTPGRQTSALTGRFLLDVDLQARPPGPNGACIATGATCWDIGADEYGAPTAVRLMSFSAVAGDGSVTLEWRTGSELDNLGFHVHRGLSADGPWTRLTSSLIPGLGSSPLGQAYSWLDSGLTNGTRYYYRLEDVDTASRSTFHGPVSAVPSPPGGDGGDDGGGDGTERRESEPDGSTSCPAWVLAAAPDVVSPTCTRHGDPDLVSLQVLARDASSATLELHTRGFWALRDVAGEVRGEVRVFVPGLEFPSDPRAPALPLRRALVDAVVGKQVQLVSAEALEVQVFRDLRPGAVGATEIVVGRDGTVRPARRSVAPPVVSRGYLPREVARLAGTTFQGERKSAVVEIFPVRFSGSQQELVLAGRVRVRLAFTGVVDGESGTGTRGRAVPRKGAASRDVLAQLHTSRRGLHAVRYEDLFAQRPRGLSTLFLRLQRQSEAVPFHIEPPGPVFGPGSVLYFHADRTASSMDYSSEVAYELVRSSGAQMGVAPAPPLGGPVVSSSTGFASFETNRIYQPGLLEAADPWLWDYLASGATRAQGFTLSGVDTTSGEQARLAVYLQGGSESGLAVDHHLRLSVNGASVGETYFAGKRPHRVDLLVPAPVLREGANELSVANVGDRGVASRVYLDRFEIKYPQASTIRHGRFEGVWAESGTVEVSGLSGPPVILRDSGLPGLEGSTVRWLTGFQAIGASLRFQAEAEQRYLVVSPEGLLTPRVGRVALSALRETSNQADYLVIAPRELVGAAQPLLERRRGQGLTSRAVAFEEIASEFGHGQPSAEAIREFLSYAYHSWPRPSPRYVLLLGDATDDPRRFQATSWSSPLPALWAKTSYLWTVSDPAVGAVNGEDGLPDLAVGRLPARTREEAEALVSKVLAWEDSGQGLAGNAVLVADNPDAGGDFEADVEDIRVSFLSGRPTTTLKVSQLGDASRPAILDSFDEGASLMSYVGHGGTAVWSTTNVLASWDAPSLRAQSRQPLLLTMNCLNGYFVAPNLDALPEALLKAEGRGVVAAFSPSGLSLDGPAHQYHRAVMAELASGAHERLGDAILAAQDAYAQTGLMPELLDVYQLLGDPATKIR